MILENYSDCVQKERGKSMEEKSSIVQMFKVQRQTLLRISMFINRPRLD
jgi:hypothetical protein